MKVLSDLKLKDYVIVVLLGVIVVLLGWSAVNQKRRRQEGEYQEVERQRVLNNPYLPYQVVEMLNYSRWGESKVTFEVMLSFSCYDEPLESRNFLLKEAAWKILQDLDSSKWNIYVDFDDSDLLKVFEQLNPDSSNWRVLKDVDSSYWKEITIEMHLKGMDPRDNMAPYAIAVFEGSDYAYRKVALPDYNSRFKIVPVLHKSFEKKDLREFDIFDAFLTIFLSERAEIR